MSNSVARRAPPHSQNEPITQELSEWVELLSLEWNSADSAELSDLKQLKTQLSLLSDS